MSSKEPIKILRLVTTCGESSSPVQQFSTTKATVRQKVTICSFFSPTSQLQSHLTLYDGKGTILGFLCAVRKALNASDYDIVHAHFAHVAVLFLLGALVFDPQILRRTVYTVHTSYPNLKHRNKFLTAVVFLFYRRIVFCGYASASSFPRSCHLLAGRRTRVIQNGVPIPHSSPIIKSPSDKNISNTFFSIVAVGRLIRLKNMESILKALAHLNNSAIHLTIIGDGVLRQELETLSQEIGVGQIKFTGSISRDSVYQYLGQSDLFVSVSRIEGLPVAALEAMAFSCPIILSDILPHREIAQGAEFIPFVPPDNPQRLAEEINRFWLMPPQERQYIGQKCRSLVNEHFNLSRMLNEYHQVYRELMGNIL